MELCISCTEPLVLEITPDDFDETTASAAGGSVSTVPDNLELSCGCHFHWQCLMDESSKVAATLSCPACFTHLTATSPPQILTSYTNEGGLQPALDILPLLQEEAYLLAHPSARAARAYLTMCSEGDVNGVVEFLSMYQQDGSREEDDEEDEDEEDDEKIPFSDLLRNQDPLNDMESALHIAVRRSQAEIVWLLLWLASSLDQRSFPPQVLDAVHTLTAAGLFREVDNGVQLAGVDIRSLKNSNAETAGDIARVSGNALGGGIADLVAAGVL